jgi:acetoin utilization deacetylase AcuC-like enzyme
MIGTYHYAYAHPMKPLRVAMTDEIVKKYELDKHFDTIVPPKPCRILNLPSSIATTPTSRP